MKTLFALLMTLMFVIPVNAQVAASEGMDPGQYFTNVVVVETDGVIYKVIESEDKPVIVTYIELPSYYDYQLARQKVNSIIKQYSDITILHPWHLVLDDLTYNIYIKVINDVTMIKYDMAANVLIIGYYSDKQSKSTAANYY